MTVYNMFVSVCIMCVCLHISMCVFLGIQTTFIDLDLYVSMFKLQVCRSMSPCLIMYIHLLVPSLPQ